MSITLHDHDCLIDDMHEMRWENDTMQEKIGPLNASQTDQPKPSENR
jgi:hypothetical protein